MQITFIQTLLIVLFSVFCIYDYLNTKLFYHCGQCVVMGCITGLILGNPVLGLQIGASLQLMTLGVAAWGGASLPDYPLGAMIGTIVAVAAGQNAEYGVMVGLPISVVAIQLDVLVRMIAVFFARRAKTAAMNRHMKSSYLWIVTGWITWALKYLIPLVLLFAVGPDRVVSLVDMIPAAITSGFKVVAGMLPALGIGILLRYMNAKSNISWVIIGFAMASYFGLSVTNVAVIGFAIALLVFMSSKQQMRTAQTVGGGPDNDEL